MSERGGTGTKSGKSPFNKGRNAMAFPIAINHPMFMGAVVKLNVSFHVFYYSVYFEHC